MPSLATVQIIGHLGKEPEMRYTQSGQPVTTFSVAVSHWHGEGKPETTSWFRVTAWGKLAERVNEKQSKGDLVFVQGSLEMRNWEGQDGKRGTSAEVNASQVLGLTKHTIKGDAGDDPYDEDLPF